MLRGHCARVASILDLSPLRQSLTYSRAQALARFFAPMRPFTTERAAVCSPPDRVTSSRHARVARLLMLTLAIV